MPDNGLMIVSLSPVLDSRNKALPGQFRLAVDCIEGAPAVSLALAAIGQSINSLPISWRLLTWNRDVAAGVQWQEVGGETPVGVPDVTTDLVAHFVRVIEAIHISDYAAVRAAMAKIYVLCREKGYHVA